MPRRRLVWPLTTAELTRMARNPSRFAPHPHELLDPAPFVPPGPPDLPADERLLLDAVLADPDADAPRLEYAAWFDGRGDDRGAFIRAQIAWHNNPRAAVECPTIRPEWYIPFAPWAARDLVFRRGFVEALSLSGRAFISISDGLFRTAPVRDVRLVAVQPFFGELAGAANLVKLDRLDLRGNQIGSTGVSALAGSPYLTRLRALDLSRNGLGSEGVAALHSAPWRSQLHTLALADNGLTAADVRTLLADPGFASLQDLDLSDNPLGPGGVPALAESGFLARAKRVSLGSTRLGPTGAAALAAATGRPTTLDLGFNEFGDDGIARLAEAPLLADVRELVLRGNRIGAAGATALIRSRVLEHVTRLDLSANFLDIAVAASLRERFGAEVVITES